MGAPHDDCKCALCVNYKCRDKRCQWADYDECSECMNPDEEYKNCKDYIDPMEEAE